MRIRDYLPQTLMGRSLLILVLPVIITQIIAVTVFWDNHWDKVTRRLADALTGEIAIIADQLENNYSEELNQILSSYLKKHLDIDLSYEERDSGDLFLEEPVSYGLYDEIILSPLRMALKEQLNYPYRVFIKKEYEERVIVKVQLSKGFMIVNVPEKRLFSSSGYVFVLLLVGSSFLLLFISILFLRNQLRPIRRLAAAASLLGKGRNVSLNTKRGALEVRQAAEAFETMQRRIRRQIEQRTAMLAGVSHDLRTPLTRVKLGLSMVEDQKEAENMMADLDEMEKMMNAYLEFARGEKIEEAEKTDLKAFLEEIIDNYRKEDLHIDFQPEDLQFMVNIQKVNFRRCIENILSNAARYANKLIVTLSMTEKRLYLIIHDDGPGIPEDQYEEVFKPFVRLDTSRSKETGGAGLGLSVAMDIVLSHGGKISLSRSELLNGLQVSIRLPV